ncbi:Zinc/iron permease [Sporodiniella umbellata]|nr:Zinc/iron permease [Sporodiniella umbellata]
MNLNYLFTAFLLLSQAYGQEDASENKCDIEEIEDYNMGLRIGSIFIILATTAIGTYTPILLHRISPYQKGGARDWLLTVGKFFGTGVILATAFVHMLPEALENFESPCLSEGWLSYGGFAGVFCMIASFALQLLEVASVSHMNKLRKGKAEKVDTEFGNTKYKLKDNENTESLSVNSKTLASPSVPCENTHHIGDDHGHTHGMFLEGDEAMNHIGTYILELGIIMHSILIGVALAVTGKDEFTTLLIALVFHQFFEGMALGTRLNEINYERWYKPVMMGFLYICMTPIGIAIGVGIHSSFNSNSYSYVLSQAILDSLSAGILLYNAYVSLMSMEISHNHAFHNSSTSRKLVCFISMYIGAGLMALIGEWA